MRWGFQLMKSPWTIKELSKKYEMEGNEEKLQNITNEKPSPQLVTRSSEQLYQGVGGDEGGGGEPLLLASQTSAITRSAQSNDGVKNMLSAFETDTNQTPKIVKYQTLIIASSKIPHPCKIPQILIYVKFY